MEPGGWREPAAMSPAAALLEVIGQAMKRHRVSQSRIGRDATGDPNLVVDLKKGRTPRPATRQMVLAYIAGLDRGRRVCPLCGRKVPRPRKGGAPKI